MIYFISDTYFCHSNIIKYCDKPFKDAKEINETIINNWNNIVNNEDIVYHFTGFLLINWWWNKKNI